MNEPKNETTNMTTEAEHFHCGTGLTIKDSGERQVFETGANRDTQAGKGRFDLLPPWAIEQLAKLYEAGCMKYGDRNWEKGIPLSRYVDSALRHTFKVLRGDADEDHLLAAAWNLVCALDTRERIKRGILPATLDNLPNPQAKLQNAYAEFDAASNTGPQSL